MTDEMRAYDPTIEWTSTNHADELVAQVTLTANTAWRVTQATLADCNRTAPSLTVVVTDQLWEDSLRWSQRLGLDNEHRSGPKGHSGVVAGKTLGRPDDGADAVVLLSSDALNDPDGLGTWRAGAVLCHEFSHVAYGRERYGVQGTMEPDPALDPSTPLLIRHFVATAIGNSTLKTRERRWDRAAVSRGFHTSATSLPLDLVPLFPEPRLRSNCGHNFDS